MITLIGLILWTIGFFLAIVTIVQIITILIQFKSHNNYNKADVFFTIVLILISSIVWSTIIIGKFI